jgi:hypothetical protein
MVSQLTPARSLWAALAGLTRPSPRFHEGRGWIKEVNIDLLWPKNEIRELLIHSHVEEDVRAFLELVTPCVFLRSEIYDGMRNVPYGLGPKY